MTPAAVPIAPGAELRELPAAIRHGLDGRELVVYGLFLDEPLTVRAVEERLARAPTGAEAAALRAIPGATLAPPQRLTVRR